MRTYQARLRALQAEFPGVTLEPDGEKVKWTHSEEEEILLSSQVRPDPIGPDGIS